MNRLIRSFVLVPTATLSAVALVAVGAVALVAPDSPISTVFAPVATAQETGDTLVFEKNGKRRTLEGVKILSDDYAEVTYAHKKRQSKVPAAHVIEIRYGDAPREYFAGWRAVRGGNGVLAKKSFDLCIEAKVAQDLRDWVDEYAQCGLGEAYRILAAEDPKALDKAVAAYAAARKANGRSRILDVILSGLADAELARGKASSALQAASDLVSAGKDAKRPLWQVRGHELRAKIEQGRGKHAEAARAYDELLRFIDSQLATTSDQASKTSLQRTRANAAASKGWVLVEKAVSSKSSADFDQARTYFDNLPGKFGQSPTILAARSNAHGVIKLSSGDAQGAVRDFQNTEVLYFTVPEEVARALYYQAACWEKLGNKSDRAARIRDLKEYFPKSTWARKVH